MRKLLLLILIMPTMAFAQLSRQDSIWLPFKPFAGKWTGESQGEPGKGKYERSYEVVMNKKYIEVKNKSVYPPSDKHPNGEVHEDHGFISYDKARKTFVLRQFHIESFVIQYVVESISPDRKTIVFISENIENIPKGFRARETYRWVNENEFVETFEVAETGNDFEVYATATLKRVQ